VFDLVLRGGLVYDGLGSPPQEVDVAVSGDRIVAVGEHLGPARRSLDLSGCSVTPGFIDVHSHSDITMDKPGCHPFKVIQGVTTEVVGNCGLSAAPVSVRTVDALSSSRRLEPLTYGEHLDRLASSPLVNNLVPLVGHNTLRLAVNGGSADIDAHSLEQMVRLAHECFEAGAVGLTTGLVYMPGSFATLDEVVSLIEVAGQYGGVYATHMRSEGIGLEDAVEEALTIAGRSGTRLQISHCKAAGASSHGKSDWLRARLRAARADGVDVYGDVYPYARSSSRLAALLPDDLLEGGDAKMLARLTDPAVRAELSAAPWGPELPAANILVATHSDPAIAGQTLQAIAGERHPAVALADAVVADPSATVVLALMSQDDVDNFVVDPLLMVGSDGGGPDEFGHPRTWGTFPFFLGSVVRDRGLVEPAEAIRRMTSFPARHFGLSGRGRVSTGAIADLCVVDLDTVGHPGTYEAPDLAPTGIRQVLVNGVLVVDEGEPTGAHGGRVLRMRS